ncbi:hyalin-like [Ptychodera flava]|uniref:hyalin-like n=1 Tax=Ptychodera flava TaxID=63121 RepID=UPI00396A29B0
MSSFAETPPEIECPDPITDYDTDGDDEHIVKYQTPSSEDATVECNPPSGSEDATVECNPPSGFAFPVGSTPVICIATDAAGNQANCSFVVTIETPPEIECPDSITDYDTDGDDEHIVKYQTPSSEDATVECNPPSGFAFPVGSTPVICIATDAAGNQANCSFVVTIETPPEIECPDSITDYDTDGDDEHIVKYQTPSSEDATVECNHHLETPPEIECPDSITDYDTDGDGEHIVKYQTPSSEDATVECNPPSGFAFPVGSTPVICIATDAAGNQVNCSFVVTIETPPEIECPDPITDYDTDGDGEHIVKYKTPSLEDATVECNPPSGFAFPVGSTPVICIATDAAGNQANCSFVVTIEDECTGSRRVWYAVPTVSDDSGVVDYECVPARGDYFIVGTTTVTCTATDGAGNKANCSLEVTVDTPPVINCGRDKTVNDTECMGSRRVWYAVPTVSDDSGVVDYECVPARGDYFIVGTTPVTCTATDGAGNKANCSLEVTVETPPEIECPDPITDCDTDGDGEQIVKYQTPSSEDATVECNPPSGFAFPVGTTPVICIATDAAGNQANCSFVVTIETPPEIECPDPITDCDTDGDGEQIVKYQTPSSEDAKVECNPPSGFAFPVGSTPVICIATDAAGNQANCSFVVTIETPPEIECPDPIMTVTLMVMIVKYKTPSSEDAKVECNPPSGFAFPVGSTPVICIATDAAGNQANCSFVVTIETPPEIECPDPITDCDTDGDGEQIVKYQTPSSEDAKVECNPPSGFAFPVGSTPVICIATDAAGNQVNCSFVVTIETPPEIECPDPITDCDTDGDGEQIVKYKTPSSEDAKVECNPPSGFAFPVGSTPVICIATDAAGNQANCSFVVTIETPPEIECPDPITDCDTDGDGEQIVKYQTPSSEDAKVECNPPSGFAFPVGSTPVICIATDAAGNQANCSFVVTIETPPEIECPDPITDCDTDGDGEQIVKYKTPSSEDAKVECNPPSGFAFPVGSTPVICIATDAAGNQANCSFVVTIETPPEIECPDPITDCDTDGDGEQIVKYQTPSSEDAKVECNPPSGFAFPVGSTPVICIATDAAGNQANCSFVVTIETPPEIECPDPITDCDTDGDGEQIVKYQTPSSEDAKVECNPPSGFAFPVGSTPVICIATDAAGNQANCSFVVTIETPPEIECPDPITDYDTDGDGEQTVKYQTPSSEDAKVECNPPSGFAFPVGSTSVICIATDAAGNQVNCSFVVTIGKELNFIPVIL